MSSCLYIYIYMFVNIVKRYQSSNNTVFLNISTANLMLYLFFIFLYNTQKVNVKWLTNKSTTEVLYTLELFVPDYWIPILN